MHAFIHSLLAVYADPRAVQYRQFFQLKTVGRMSALVFNVCSRRSSTPKQRESSVSQGLGAAPSFRKGDPRTARPHVVTLSVTPCAGPPVQTPCKGPAAGPCCSERLILSTCCGDTFGGQDGGLPPGAGTAAAIAANTPWESAGAAASAPPPKRTAAVSRWLRPLAARHTQAGKQPAVAVAPRRPPVAARAAELDVP
jgi:hypothetical protein